MVEFLSYFKKFFRDDVLYFDTTVVVVRLALLSNTKGTYSYDTSAFLLRQSPCSSIEIPSALACLKSMEVNLSDLAVFCLRVAYARVCLFRPCP